MNFAELLALHAQRRHDRTAIAVALGMTTDQIDALQREAMRLAHEAETSDTGGLKNILG
jgi:hypothetical protein